MLNKRINKLINKIINEIKLNYLSLPIIPENKIPSLIQDNFFDF